MNESDIDNAETMSATANVKFRNGDTVQIREIAPGYQPLILIEPTADMSDEGGLELNFEITSSQMGGEKEDLIGTLEMILDVLKEGETL